MVIQESKIRILNNEVHLDQYCWNCCDRDIWSNIITVKVKYLDGQYCPECENKRLIPTDLGLEILGFVRKYL